MGNYSDPIQIRLPEGDKRLVEQYAERRGLNRSEAIRRLVDRGLLREGMA